MRMNIHTASRFVVFWVCLFLSAQTNARCEQLDMAGLWHLFLGKGSAIINISGAGYVSDGHYRHLLDDDYGVGFAQRGLLSGSVDVLNNCRIVARFELEAAGPFPVPVELHITDSRTRPDTQYWAGNFRITMDWDFLPIDEGGSFYAVRILDY